MRSLTVKTKKLIHNEQGAIGIVVLLIVFIAIFLTPFLLDFANVQYSRSRAQTGTDAAAMAAAVQLAQDLSLCTEWTSPSGWYRDPEAAMEDRRRVAVGNYYGRYYSPFVNSGRHEQAANQYARANVNNLQNWQYSYSFGKSISIKGRSFYDIRPFVRFARPVQTFTKELSKRGFDTPAQAASEVYLENGDWRFEASIVATRWVCDVPCESGCCAGHWEYKAIARFCIKWKVRLIR